jgi:hypothetical protein
MPNREGRLLRTAFAAGAITDALAVAPMLSPKLAGALWGFKGLTGPYFLAMGSAAALMLGWSGLLIWAWQRPLERRFVAALTMFVIGGLGVTEAVGVAAGWVSVRGTAPTWVLQAALLVLFGTAYRTSAPRSAESDRGRAEAHQ